MNRPLPIAFCLFTAGIIFARWLPVSFPAVIGLTALFFILFLLFRTRHKFSFYIISSGLAVLLGAVSYLNFNNLPACHITHLLRAQPEQYYIQGAIASSPDHFWGWGRKRCSFLFKTQSYKKNHSWVKLSGLSRVNIKDCQREYSYGEALVIFGDLKRPPTASNPGQFDYAEYLKTRRIYALIDVESDDSIMPLKGASPPALKKAVFEARAGIERLVGRYLPGRDAAILNAMLIGRRAALTGRLRERFIRTGTAHILAISGLHVAIVSAMIFFILRFISIPRKISSILVIGFLAVYALFTGARPPILRATIMITACLLGYVLERDFDIYSALSMAGIIILLMNPAQLFNAGFALSFACVFSICYLTPRLESLFAPSPGAVSRLSLIKKNSLARYLLRLILGSLAVYIGVWPLIGYFFNIASPVTILANLFVVPFLGAVLFFGIFFIIAGSLSVFLAAVFSYPVHFLISVLMQIIFFLSNIPFAYFYIPDIPLYGIAAYYILILLLIERKKFGLNWLRILAAALLIINLFVWSPFFSRTDRLRVTFLDVGRGSSAFLEFPDGKTMLINAGRRRGFYYDEGEEIILPFIWSRGRKSIDALFLTHSDSAHLGAALSVLKKIRAGYFISSGLDGGDRLHQKLKELIGSGKVKGIKAEEGLEIEGFDDVSISVITPSRIKLTYKKASFLFSPGESIVGLGEGRPWIADTTSGAKTIITDGRRILTRPF